MRDEFVNGSLKLIKCLQCDGQTRLKDKLNIHDMAIDLQEQATLCFFFSFFLFLTTKGIIRLLFVRSPTNNKPAADRDPLSPLG